MKRMAIFLPSLHGGGGERVMLNLAIGLASAGLSVDLVLAEATGRFLNQIPRTVRVVVLNSRLLRAFRTIACLPALVNYLRHERPDVLFSAMHANIVAVWAGSLSKSNTRIVVSEHSILSHQMQTFPRWYRWMMLRLIRWFYPRAYRIVAVSKGAADDLSRLALIPRENIQVIYNPIVTPQMQRMAEVAIEHPWFKPGEPPVVLSVGRLAAEKDYITLIQAFFRVRQRQNARLLILGEGEDRSNLEALSKQLDLDQDVQLPGFNPNPFPFMIHAPIFVLSSKYEALPTVLVEALYCGATVVATDCHSGPREILQGGKYGRLVPVGNVEALADVISSELVKLHQRAPEESWRPFEMRNIVNQYCSILQDI